MPYIPLLKAPGPIANAPAPAPDNLRRPDVDNRAVSQAVGNLADASTIKPVDAGDFTAPYEALGTVGRAIAQGGSVLSGLAIKKREAQTDIQVAEADQAMQDAFNEHAAWRTTNPDTTAWEGNLSETLNKARQSIEGNEGLHPAARDTIRLRLNKFEGDAKADLLRDSAKQEFRRAGSVYEASIQRAMTAKNYDEALKISKEAEAKGYRYDHETAGLEENISRSRKLDIQEAEREEKLVKARAFDTANNAAVGLAGNAGEAAAIKDLDSGKFGKFEPVEKERIRNSIQQVGRDRAAVEMDDLVSGIIGNALSSDSHIDAWESPHLTPVLRQKAKDYLASRDAQAEKKERDENGVRNAVEMRQRVKAYEPSKDPDRTQYFELVKEIGSRVEQSSAGEITGDLYRKYGTTPPEKEVRPEIQRNVSKSLDVTFDPETGAVPWKRQTPVLDNKGKPVLDENNNPKTTTTEDPAARQRAIDAQTVVEMRMNDWYKMNPEKANDIGAVKKAMTDFLPDGTRMGALDTLQKLMTPPPVNIEPPNLGAQGDSGPDGEEFIAPPAASRVTSYAYSNDETPDSNSSAGIGAFVPDEEQAKIKRGEESAYKLREGDFAVSPDVEKSLRRAGIRPGDEVAVKMEDGSTQSGRWMDRTAAEWEGKAVTGRWDFYRGGKRTKHEKEAMKVTGFRRS